MQNGPPKIGLITAAMNTLAATSINNFFKSRNNGHIWNRQGVDAMMQAKAEADE